MSLFIVENEEILHYKCLYYSEFHISKNEMVQQIAFPTPNTKIVIVWTKEPYTYKRIRSLE